MQYRNGKTIQETPTDPRKMKHVHIAYAASNWFQLPKPFLHTLPANAAILLAVLIDKAARVQAIDRYDGWFYYKMDDIREDTGLSPDQQTNLMRCLRQKKLVKTKHSGVPAKRYIKINFRKVANIIEAWWESRVSSSVQSP